MNYGFMGKILRVNLSQGRVSAEPIRDDWAQQFLGGAGLATKYLYEEAPRERTRWTRQRAHLHDRPPHRHRLGQRQPLLRGGRIPADRHLGACQLRRHLRAGFEAERFRRHHI